MIENDQRRVSEDAKAVADITVATVTDHLMSKPSWSDLNDRVAAVERRWKSLVRFLAVVLLVTLTVASYLAINLHEVYRDTCEPALVLGPVPEWCDNVFIGDDDPGQQPDAQHDH